jgi:hypothetical protein
MCRNDAARSEHKWNIKHHCEQNDFFVAFAPAGRVTFWGMGHRDHVMGTDSYTLQQSRTLL